jgi:hypothetical protein
MASYSDIVGSVMKGKGNVGAPKGMDYGPK